MKRLLITCLPILFTLATGCELINDSDLTATGDYDWAHQLADDYITSNFSEEAVLTNVESALLDDRGCLFNRHPHSYWYFNYIVSDFEVILFVYSNGQISATILDDPYPNDGFSYDINSESIISWIDLASYYYRYLTGRTNDEYYMLYCHGYSDTLYISLYNDELTALCFIRMDPINGQLEKLYIY